MIKVGGEREGRGKGGVLMSAYDTRADDEVWDRVVYFILRIAGAMGIGMIVFIDVLILDLYYQKAVLAAALISACLITRIGVWTLRRLVLGLTIYAVGYLVGALPAIGQVGAFLSRHLG